MQKQNAQNLAINLAKEGTYQTVPPRGKVGDTPTPHGEGGKKNRESYTALSRALSKSSQNSKILSKYLTNQEST